MRRHPNPIERVLGEAQCSALIEDREIRARFVRKVFGAREGLQPFAPGLGPRIEDRDRFLRRVRGKPLIFQQCLIEDAPDDVLALGGLADDRPPRTTNRPNRRGNPIYECPFGSPLIQDTPGDRHEINRIRFGSTLVGPTLESGGVRRDNPHRPAPDPELPHERFMVASGGFDADDNMIPALLGLMSGLLSPHRKHDRSDLIG